MRLTGIQQTAMYALSVALMRGVSLLMLPIVAGYLPPQEFGRLEVISSLAVVASVLAGLGMEDALYRFVGQSRNEFEKNQAAATIFTFTLIIAFFLVLISYPLGRILIVYLPAQVSLYAMQLLLLTLAMEGLIAVPLGWLRMRERALTFCGLSVGRVFLQSLLVFGFLANGRGVEGVLEASFIATLAQGLCLTWIQIKDTGIKFNRILFNKTLIYSLPLVGSGLLAFGLNGLDRWIIAESLSLEAVALYGVAAKFSIAVVLLIQPYGMWWMPRRFVELNRIQGKQIVQRFSTMGLVIVILMAFFVGLFGPYLAKFIMPSQYTHASSYLLGLVLVIALREATEYVNIGCFIQDKTNIQLWINLIATSLGCLSLFLLIENLGVWGVILSLAFAQGLRLVLFLYFSQRVLWLDYPLGKIAFLCIYVTGSLYCNFLILNERTFATNEKLMALAALLLLSMPIIFHFLNKMSLLPSWKLEDVMQLFSGKRHETSSVKL